MSDNKQIYVITGPTASGKSSLALHLAEKIDGVIINADSMQIYSDIPIVTACPSAEDYARVPHRLYACMDGAQACNVAEWMALAIAEIEEVVGLGKVPVLVGGTGMYLKSLMEGIAPIPEAPQTMRESLQQRLDEEGNATFHEYLTQIDPLMGVRLNAGDSLRMLRAAEVMEHTGRSIALWRQDPVAPPIAGAEFHLSVMLRERSYLYERINQRFDVMVAQGALEEVEALAARNLDNKLPVMRALGVPELLAYSAGKCSLDEARDEAAKHSRRYAKRQMTFMRGQLPDATCYDLDTQRSEDILADMVQR